MKEKKPKRILADTSAVISGIITREFAEKGSEIFIPLPVVQELEHQANVGKAIGVEGLDELNKLSELSKEKKFKLEFVGKPVEKDDIKYAYTGKIDSIIRDLANQYNATLVTSDKTQASVATAMQIACSYFEPKVREAKSASLPFEKYFDKLTMSVHLKENLKVKRKTGGPGNWVLEELKSGKMTKDFLNEVIDMIIEEAHRDLNSFIEIDMRGCTVVQLREYRIVITKHPFSDSTELTIVKPIKHMSLDDYKLSSNLLNRLKSKAEGILVVGPPGAGKTTFAQAIAEFYNDQGKIVKTMEQPRDLQVSKEITQYGPLNKSMANTGDILLLVRPDYTIYDEIRRSNDFKIFEDLRLAGVGMVGVSHASQPIDAIQRFVGRVELGVIPQVVDTLIFIKDGVIDTVYTLNMAVKVPTGMVEQDLARPVVEVKDFETRDLQYEIYSYGEEVVVIPVKSVKEQKAKNYDDVKLPWENRIKKYAPGAKIEYSNGEVTVSAPSFQLKKLIGRKGSTIHSLEKSFGVKISVFEGSEDYVKVKAGGKNILLSLGAINKGKQIKIMAAGQELLTGIADSKGVIKVRNKSKMGRKILNALDAGHSFTFENVF